MQKINHNDKWQEIRYSSLFSRSFFNGLLKHGDMSIINGLISDYGVNCKGKPILTYYDYLCYIYRFMVKNYRNEYIFKNTLLNAVIKKYGTSKSIVFNEFPVGSSIVDMAMFNGVSRAFEIKTELDTERRLFSQIDNYKRIFQESYVVVYETMAKKYAQLTSEDVGIIPLRIYNGRLKVLEPFRYAKRKDTIEVETLMKCLRTSEYKHIVKTYYGTLPTGMNDFNAYDMCQKAMEAIPQTEVIRLFISEMKRRKNNIKELKQYDSHIRQICLSMHISPKEYNNLNKILSQPIKL